MKKKLFITGIIAFLMCASFSIGAFAATKISVYFNNKKQNLDVKVINKKPYVPLTNVASLFGGKVTFDSKKNIYKITSKDYNPNPSKALSYKLNILETSGPMEIKITKATLDPAYKVDKYSTPINAVVFDTQVTNLSSNKVSWYPNQAIFALNTGEQIEDTILYSDDLGGQFLGNAYKKGRIILKVKSNLDKVNAAKVSISTPINEDWDSVGNNLDFTIKIR